MISKTTQRLNYIFPWLKHKHRGEQNTNVCENKCEFENPRHNPYILAAPHLASTIKNFLLPEQNFFLTEHC